MSAAQSDNPTDAPAVSRPQAAVSQTVTLVLTDVEGSTRMWADHPGDMATVMARHHQIVHTAVAAHGGWRPVDQGEGDAVFAVFDSPTSAVAAVATFQQELAAEPWPPGIRVGVRVGVHTGEVTVRDGNLYGSTVNRCARLRGLGAGGQVVLSASSWEVVRDRLPDGVTVIDLGEHRMKDLARPEHVHQLVIAGLPAEFPPLASLDRARHNLPVQASSFLGRDTEIQELAELASRERLVTVLGFGGTGKTRLALQVAAELATGDGDGVWLVDLSAETEPQRIPAVINTAVGISEGPDGPLPALLAGLADKRLLLVLDNLEQLLPDAARTVADIAAAGPGVRVLVTSREPLRVRGEHVFALAPLPVPPPPRPPLTDAEVGRLSTYTAVSLFLTRAAAARRDFVLTPQNAASVAAICTRLDGLPLAIELAAARTRLLSPDALLPRLDNALKVLVGGNRDLPTRHQTLRATIAWSYDALDPDQQQLLDRLSVFPGTFTLDAAEAVCGPALADGDDDLDVLDGMGLLVDRSLVRQHPATDDQRGDRYDLLVSIRDFATEQLAHAGQTITIADRHAAHYTVITSYHASDTWDEILRADRLSRSELHHLRAALSHVHLHGTPEQEQLLASRAVPMLFRAGRQTEAQAAADRALDRSTLPSVGRIRLLADRAASAITAFRWGEAHTAIDAALGAARQLGAPSILVESLAAALPAARSTDEYTSWVSEAELFLTRSTPGNSLFPGWYVRHLLDGALASSLLTPWTEAEAALRRQLVAAPIERKPALASNLVGLLGQHGRWQEAAAWIPVWETSPGPPFADLEQRLLGALNASEVRMALGQVAQATADVDLLADLIRENDVPEHYYDLPLRRAAIDRLDGHLSSAGSRLLSFVGNVTTSGWDRASAHRLLAVIARESGDHDSSARYLDQAWGYVIEQGAPALELAGHCLLERAVSLGMTDPSEAARLIGLVRTHRSADRFTDYGVVYDTEVMLADLRVRLGDQTIEGILTEAATQPLPDRPDWTTSNEAEGGHAHTD